ncbi:MAG: glycosyltransferase [Clostridia bacterium]|nr:glycosyltransferase [Clostridia bacterium]
MKILYLINYAGKAGTEKYVENLIGHCSGKPDTECFLCYNVAGELSEKCVARGVRCFRLEMRSPFDLKAARALAAICRDNEIDVIHAQFPRENYIALLSKRYYDRPKVIFTAHLIMRQPAVWKIFNRIMTKKNDCVLAVCNAGAEVLRENGVCPDVIRIVYNGIRASEAAILSEEEKAELRSSLGIPDGSTVISIMARFSPEKGLDFLADSVSLMKTADHSVVIMGDGDGMDDFRKRISDLGIADRFILTGYRNDCSRILAVSDIYVSSSKEEAMSYATLEAMAAGLPLVVTDVGGNPTLAEEGGKCGEVVRYGDAAGYAEALDKLCRDPGLRDRYGAVSAEKTKTLFDHDKLMDRIYEIYGQ